MTTVHIEGMGWLGVIAGRACEALGLDFTWHDIESPHRAWPISTGCVYPDKEVRSVVDLDTWRFWHAERRFGSATEESDWWFNHKHPPHGAKFPITADVGALRRGDETCVRVDVARIVREHRERWAGRRTEGEVHADWQVIAHGFGPRSDRVMWGWACRVTLDLAPELIERSPRGRPTIYTRLNRYAFAYAYPIPGEDVFWAGSSFISQPLHRINDLDGNKHYERWLEIWAQTTGGLASVSGTAGVVSGWRPQARAGDSGNVEVIGRLVTVPPLSHSGIRWAPRVQYQLERALAGKRVSAA